jgi:cell division protein FtsW (lipid II flippase)
VLLGSSLLITALGLVMVYSASQIKALEYGLPSTYYFRKQLFAAVLGTGLLVAASRLSVRVHRALAYPLLAGACFLMALVQVPGIGQSVRFSSSRPNSASWRWSCGARTCSRARTPGSCSCSGSTCSCRWSRSRS